MIASSFFEPHLVSEHRGPEFARVCVCVVVQGRTFGSVGMGMRVRAQGREVSRVCRTSGQNNQSAQLPLRWAAVICILKPGIHIGRSKGYLTGGA